MMTASPEDSSAEIGAAAPDAELTPLTEPGRRWVEIAESCVDGFAERAAEHDAAGSFPFESIEELRSNGFVAAQVPEELGGLGATSVHDWAVAMTRLGRGDGATAIAVNMHLLGTWRQVRVWEDAKARGDDALREALEPHLVAIGRGELLTCGTVTEPGTSLVEPRTTLTPAAGGEGWVLNGRKGFGTMSPAADVIFVSARLAGAAGEDEVVTALVPKSSPGVEVLDNWDAMGMRASGSNDVEFVDVAVPADAVLPGGPFGELNPSFLTVFGPGVLGLSASFVGIAEAARASVLGMLRKRRRGADGTLLATRRQIQREFGELEMTLAACRAIVARAGTLLDDYFTAVPESEATMDGLLRMMREVQCAKQFVSSQAASVVDRALTLSGGAGYTAKSPLARMYRDVRASAFMQPFSPLEGLEYIGCVSLGADARRIAQ
jgi:alkylation response protein AidB-like acyl-CoA dehydrogenase